MKLWCINLDQHLSQIFDFWQDQCESILGANKKWWKLLEIRTVMLLEITSGKIIYYKICYQWGFLSDY